MGNDKLFISKYSYVLTFLKLLGSTVKRMIFLFIILLCNVKFANGQNDRFSFSTGGAINVNDFNWSIAGNLQGKSPNILSELVFQNITSLGFYLEGTYNPLRYLQLNALYQRNGVARGQGTDTDYGGDNRTNPTFHQPFSSDKGHLEIFKAGVKYNFLHRDKFILGAGTSYKSTVQNFVILSLDLTDLKSTYRARWQGMDVSIAGTYQMNQALSVGADISYSVIRYRAEANWNLIDIFMQPLSFAQTSKGQGMDFGLRSRYTANNFLSFSLDGMLGNTRAFKGTDISYLKNGTQISTQFNGSKNDFYGVRLGAIIHF